MTSLIFLDLKPSDLHPRVVITNLKGLCTFSLFLQSKLTSSRIASDKSIGAILDQIMKPVEFFIQKFLCEPNNPDLKRLCQPIVAVFTDYLMEALGSENANVILGEPVFYYYLF